MKCHLEILILHFAMIHFWATQKCLNDVYLLKNKASILLSEGGEIHMANKAELIENVATSTGLTKKDATSAVDAVFESIQTSLSEGEKVQIIGFGNFEVRDRAARKGRNPQTGEEIQIAASKVPAFKPGKALKDAVK